MVENIKIFEPLSVCLVPPPMQHIKALWSRMDGLEERMITDFSHLFHCIFEDKSL